MDTIFVHTSQEIVDVIWVIQRVSCPTQEKKKPRVLHFWKLKYVSYLFPSIEQAIGLAQSPSFVPLHDKRGTFSDWRGQLGRM